MAWTAPRTWQAEDPITAAQLNQHIRDNLLETEVAKASTAGQLIMTSDDSTVVARAPVVASASGTVSTSSTTPVALSGGPSITFTHGGNALVLWGAEIWMSAGTGGVTSAMRCGPNMIGIGGGSTSRSTAHAATNDARVAYGGHTLFTGMTPGSNTVELNYWRDNVTVLTASFANRRLIVVPF